MKKNEIENEYFSVKEISELLKYNYIYMYSKIWNLYRKGFLPLSAFKAKSSRGYKVHYLKLLKAIDSEFKSNNNIK